MRAFVRVRSGDDSARRSRVAVARRHRWRFVAAGGRKTAMEPLAVGVTFAEHEIRGVVGRGGMGVVYRALDVRLNREGALKVIAPEMAQDDVSRARFRRELEAVAPVAHSNVVAVYHAGEEDGLLFVTMPLIDGIDLGRLIAAEGPLDPVRAAHVVARVAD